jgi:hypothetical protein
MASIRKEILINARPEEVWAAVRDVGAVHKRLVPDVVVDAHLDAGARVVTFANGVVARELIVDVDDEAQQFAYASVGGRATHHNASMQVCADGEGRSRLIWITDVLPNDLAAFVSDLVEQGAAIMKQTLEEAAARG